MRIMFMGTPEIAATVLSSLIDGGREVVAVVTGKDKPRGRGKQLTPTPVRALADARGIDVYTPDTLRDEAFIDCLRRVKPDIIVVVAYGKILPRAVLEFPPMGCINLHVSLLPKYRGAAPMQRAVMNGERETGVSIMYMAEGLDTGDVLATRAFPIGEEDDFEVVHDTSAVLGSELLLGVLSDIEAGVAVATPQDESLATYAAKVEKSDAKIDFNLPARVLDPVIRGVTPIPGAFCYQGDKMLKIFKARPTDGVGEPGRIIAVDERGEGSFTVACGEGALTVRGVIPEGKGRMTAGDYLRGRKLGLGDVLK